MRSGSKKKEGEAAFPLLASGVGSNLRATRRTSSLDLKGVACAQFSLVHVAFQSRGRAMSEVICNQVLIYQGPLHYQPEPSGCRGLQHPTDFYIQKTGNTDSCKGWSL